MVFKVLLTFLISFNTFALGIEENCRFFCKTQNIECLESITDKELKGKEKQFQKNKCFSQNINCSTICTNQQVELNKDKDYQKYKKLKERYNIKKWYPYKRAY